MKREFMQGYGEAGIVAGIHVGQINPKFNDGGDDEAGADCLLTLSDVCCLPEWLQDLEHVLEDVTIICSDGGCIELLQLSSRYSKHRASHLDL